MIAQQILQTVILGVGAGMLGDTYIQSIGIFFVGWAIMPQGKL